MTPTGPGPTLDAARVHPMVLPDGQVVSQVVHLNQVIDHPRWQVGDFTYAHFADPPADPAAVLAPYLFPPSPERLVIGRFCQIAAGVRFLTASGNHALEGFSTYPFANFLMTPATTPEELAALLTMAPAKGDTDAVNDVWLGMEALVLPGVTLGDGVIVGARSVVSRDVPPYSVVAGNPARVVRRRFDEDTIEALCTLRWWDWPPAVIARHHAVIAGADLAALRRIAATL